MLHTLGPGVSNLQKVDNLAARVNLLTIYVRNFNSKCRASRPAERARGRVDLPSNFRDVDFKKTKTPRGVLASSSTNKRRKVEVPSRRTP